MTSFFYGSPGIHFILMDSVFFVGFPFAEVPSVREQNPPPLHWRGPKPSKVERRGGGLLAYRWYPCMFWIPNTIFFLARFARRIASVSYVFAASGAQILQKIPGALRAPDCLKKSLRGSLRDCLGTKSGNRNLRKRDWPLKKTLQAVGLMIAAPDRPPFLNKTLR